MIFVVACLLLFIGFTAYAIVWLRMKKRLQQDSNEYEKMLREW